MKKHLWGITALLLSAVMFIFGAAVQSREESGTAGIAYAQGNTGEQDAESPFKQVYRQVSPSVVGIEVSSPSVIFGGRISTQMAFAGSGVVIGENGYVLTNEHVVSGAEESALSDNTVPVYFPEF